LIDVLDVDLPSMFNISTRGQVNTGNGVMIGGFVIDGDEPKTVLVRVQGPSLADFGLSGVLANPNVEIYSGNTKIAQNNDWQTTDPLCGAPAIFCGNSTDIQNTGKDPCSVGTTGCNLESAVYITLPPGPYTAIATGVGGGTGLGLVAAIDVNEGTFSRMVNISTRASVQTGNGVMIGGFVVKGSEPKKVLIRVNGPTLADFGLSGVLANPKVEVYSGMTKFTQNDNWQTTDPLCDSPAVACGDATDIQNTGKDPCSVGTTGCNLDSAVLVTLPPGPYTAIASGVGGGTGIALVGIIEILDP
jgi:hypothetical protein